MTESIFTEVFYEKGDYNWIDVVNPFVKDSKIGAYSKQTLEEIRQRYPNADVYSMEEATQLANQAAKEKFVQHPEEISEEEYWYYLEVLPPEDWVQKTGESTFKLSERDFGNYTTICVKYKRRYFKLCNLCTLTHDKIIDLVKQHLGENK